MSTTSRPYACKSLLVVIAVLIGISSLPALVTPDGSNGTGDILDDPMNPFIEFFESDVYLGNGSINAMGPDIAVDCCNGAIYAVWEQDLEDRNWNLYFSRSMDSGRTWSESIRINDDSSLCGQNWSPSIAINKNTGEIYVVWEDNRNAECHPDNTYEPTTYKPNLRFSKSSDGGLTWGDGLENNNDIVVNDGGTGALNGYEQEIVVDSNTGAIYVIWYDYRGGPDGWGIRFSKSTDGGMTWGDGIQNDNDIRVDDDTTDSTQMEPSIAVDSNTGYLYAVWNDVRLGDEYLFFSKSTDEGDTWGDGLLNNNDLRIDDAVMPDGGMTENPTIVVDENTGNLYSMWAHVRNYTANVYFSNSTDGGSTWGDGLVNNNDVKVPDDNYPIDPPWDPFGGPTQSSQSVAIDDTGNIYAAWRDDRGIDAGIYYSNSSDGGGTWGDGIRNNNDVQVDHDNDTGIGNTPADEPEIAVDSVTGSVYVIWEHYRKVGPDFKRGVYFTSTPGILPKPQAPFLYAQSSQNGKDIILNWTESPPCSRIHYLIYRSESQTSFNFSTPWVNTSIDVNPITGKIDPQNALWIDNDVTNNGHPNYRKEYYYIVVAENQLSMKSNTSNTAGYFAKQFTSGPNTLSMPLQPFEPRALDVLMGDLGAATISWLDSNDDWQTFPSNPSVPLVVMGKGYVLDFPATTSYVFTGEPASMIIYKNGFGFDDTTRDDISATVSALGDVTLSWTPLIDAEYLIYKSDKRDGFFMGSSSILNGGAPVPGPPFVDIGAASSPSENYYMIVPQDPVEGTNGSSTYSIGIITEEYNGNEMFGLPLKPIWGDKSADWYVDNILNALGLVYLEDGIWKAHFKEFPEGVYDSIIERGRGYELTVNNSSLFTYIGW